MYKFYRGVLSALGWGVTVLLTIFFGTTSVIGSLISSSGKMQHWSLKWWGRCICFMSSTKVRMHGLENVNKDGPQVFASNHQSVYDILVLGGWLPVQFAWVARKEWFNYPFLGWYLHRSGAINIDRSNPPRGCSFTYEGS
jgi:1-acyl-sn-glycerol-3-phosphate acyltransferase